MAAHNICASIGCAPNLLYCGDAKRGFKMIVMDYINDVPFKKEKISTMESQACKQVFNHNQCKGMLVDFDWCGKHNQDTYPLAMNTEIPWPDGARSGALLMKAHDKYWLEEDLNL
ncbi:9652_t:CDS:2, partial [Diversispora eburnea]